MIVAAFSLLRPALLFLVALGCVSLAQAGQAPAETTAFAFDGPPAPIAPDVVTRDAEGRATVRAVRLPSPIRLDGALDEALYSTPSISGFIQVEPDMGAPATEQTEMWFAFDSDNIYLSFRCWDSQPERRVASDMRRDASGMFNGNDVINVYLDTFYDRRNGISFTLNSIGARNDGQVVGPQYNGDWNPIWDFAVGRFDGGWTIEMVVPFRSLRYRQGTAQVWGINVLRTVRWRSELSVLTPVPPGRGNSSAQYAPLAATVVGLEAPPPARNLDIKPYAISTVTTDVNASRSNDFGRDAGLDVKYSVTQNLVADFTYNTDFAQVEADEQQVNLTRFSLFFPEKREFFLENRDTFTFGGVTSGSGDAPVLFYSRRIGLEDGRPVPIDAGGRLTGRVGRFTMGAMNIQTDRAPVSGAPGTNFTVARLKRDILRESSIGAIVTARSVGQGGTAANAAYGLDGAFNFFNDLAINTYWARSQTEGVRTGDTSYRAQLDFPGDRYGVQLERLRIGESFNPDVGFVRRADIERTYGQLRFSPRPRSVASVRRFLWIGAIDYIENGAGRAETREQSGEFAIEFRNADRFGVVYTDVYEFIPRPFRIADGVVVPVGGYNWRNAQATFNMSQQRRWATSFVAEYGTFYSGHRTSLSASRGRMAFTPQFAVEPSYTVNFVDLAEGSFTTHLAGSRLVFTVSPRMFATALVQYNSGTRSMTANARFRWEYQPGSELFVVYNDERDTRASGFPGLMTRSFVVKINRLFRF